MFWRCLHRATSFVYNTFVDTFAVLVVDEAVLKGHVRSGKDEASLERKPAQQLLTGFGGI